MIGSLCQSSDSCTEDSGALTVLDAPHGIVCAPDSGLLYIADKNNHRVVVLKQTGERVATIGTGIKGRGINQLNRPWGVAVSAPPASAVYVTDRGNNCVKVQH